MSSFRCLPALAGAPLLAVVLSACSAASPSEPPVAFEGPDEGTVINADALDTLALRATLERGDDVELPDEPFADASWTHGERDVTDQIELDGGVASWDASDLDDGDHEVAVTLPALGRGVEHTWEFAVAATPPELTVTEPEDGVLIASDGLTIAGESTGVEVALGQATTEVADDGTFSLELDEAPQGPAELVATDEHGNTATTETELVVVPSRVEREEVRAVHVTPHAWATPSFRERIESMIADGLINAVQLDLKDEGGRIGYDTEVELARESGAAEDVYDLDEAVADLHAMDVPVIGRIVAFRDPVLGQHAVDTDQLDMLVQTTDGEPYTAGYGCCFTSFVDEDVIAYNLAIAEEAVAAGVDHILWDYIRRPDGDPANLVYAGLEGDGDGGALEAGVVDFARQADERLAPYGIQHGASLYGIAADRPTQIAQDVPAMAEHLDYVAPMIYPSHWGPGEYGVSEPNRQPYDIITATLEVWAEQVEGTRARIVPWLEDTSYRAWDRPHQVREQIRAAADAGIDEWLMWDPNVRYTLEAYDPREIEQLDPDEDEQGDPDGADDGDEADDADQEAGGDGDAEG